MEASVAESSPKSSPESVFARIALSLSGGGFRASAYSLGTLNVLYLLGLLDNVHLLSTASGGTLTGLFYAARRKQGDSFPVIYKAVYDWLEQDKLLPGAIENWELAVAKGGSDIKLIHAFANTYDQQLHQQQFGVFWQTFPKAPPFHLQSVIFGATELYSGLTFRFQYAAILPESGFTIRGVKQPASYYIGNGNVHLTHADAKQVRLGDIAAASSCFPVGFEPLVLPDDFENATGHKPVVHGRHGMEVPAKIALIDGGVYDNQGIESLLLANARNADYCQSIECQRASHSQQELALLEPTSLFLVADVDAASTGLYDAMKPVFAPGKGLSMQQAVGYAVGGVLGLLVAGGLLVDFGRARGSFLAGSLVMLGGLIVVGLLVGWWAWRKLTARLRALDERIYQLAVPVFLKLPLAQWARLLVVRVRTASVLLQSVFTRRVRSQSYSLLYQNGPARQAPVIASIIGGLGRSYSRMQPGQQRNEVGSVQQTVQTASEMGTTLWWGNDDQHRLPAIVNTAGLTLCYRLLKYLKKNKPATDLDRQVERRATLLWQAYVASFGQELIEPNVLVALAAPTCTLDSLLVAVRTGRPPAPPPALPPPPRQPAS